MPFFVVIKFPYILGYVSGLALFYPINLLKGSNLLSSEPSISYVNLSKLLHLSKLLSLYLQNSNDNLIRLLKRLNLENVRYFARTWYIVNANILISY